MFLDQHDTVLKRSRRRWSIWTLHCLSEPWHLQHTGPESRFTLVAQLCMYGRPALPSVGPRDSGWGGHAHSSICTRSPVELALVPLRFGRLHVWMERAIIGISAEDQNPIFRKVFNAELNKASSKSSPPSLPHTHTHTRTQAHKNMSCCIQGCAKYPCWQISSTDQGRAQMLDYSHPLTDQLEAIYKTWNQTVWDRSANPGCCWRSTTSSQNIRVICQGSMQARSLARRCSHAGLLIRSLTE